MGLMRSEFPFLSLELWAGWPYIGAITLHWGTTMGRNDKSIVCVWPQGLSFGRLLFSAPIACFFPAQET